MFIQGADIYGIKRGKGGTKSGMFDRVEEAGMKDKDLCISKWHCF
jgi:hypothetical protein